MARRLDACVEAGAHRRERGAPRRGVDGGEHAAKAAQSRPSARVLGARRDEQAVEAVPPRKRGWPAAAAAPSIARRRCTSRARRLLAWPCRPRWTSSHDHAARERGKGHGEALPRGRRQGWRELSKSSSVRLESRSRSPIGDGQRRRRRMSGNRDRSRRLLRRRTEVEAAAEPSSGRARFGAGTSVGGGRPCRRTGVVPQREAVAARQRARRPCASCAIAARFDTPLAERLRARTPAARARAGASPPPKGCPSAAAERRHSAGSSHRRRSSARANNLTPGTRARWRAGKEGSEPQISARPHDVGLPPLRMTPPADVGRRGQPGRRLTRGARAGRSARKRPTCAAASARSQAKRAAAGRGRGRGLQQGQPLRSERATREASGAKIRGGARRARQDLSCGDRRRASPELARAGAHPGRRSQRAAPRRSGSRWSRRASPPTDEAPSVSRSGLRHLRGRVDSGESLRFWRGIRAPPAPT